MISVLSDRLANEPYRAVRKSKVCPAWMETVEAAYPVVVVCTVGAGRPINRDPDRPFIERCQQIVTRSKNAVRSWILRRNGEDRSSSPNMPGHVGSIEVRLGPDLAHLQRTSASRSTRGERAATSRFAECECLRCAIDNISHPNLAVDVKHPPDRKRLATEIGQRTLREGIVRGRPGSAAILWKVVRTGWT